MNRLKEIGVKISLDDFGTGHSSLSQLQKLPIDKIKIDRSFINDVDTNAQSFSIVKTVLVLSESLGLDCVVEGVETAQQADILQSLQADKVQGYLYSKPIAQHEVAAFLAENWRANAAA